MEDYQLEGPGVRVGDIGHGVSVNEWWIVMENPTITKEISYSNVGVFSIRIPVYLLAHGRREVFNFYYFVFKRGLVRIFRDGVQVLYASENP